MQPEVPHRRRRGANRNSKKKNRQGDPKIHLKPKASLTSNQRHTVYYKSKAHTIITKTGATLEKKGRPGFHKKTLGAPPHTGPPHRAIGEADPHCAVRDSSNK